MKMLFLIYSREIDEAIVAAFKRAGIRGYTQMKDISGEGGETEPKLGSHVWPGKNNALFIAVEDEDVKTGMDLIRQVKKEHPREGLKVFVFPLEQCL